MPALIRARWNHNQRLALANGETLLPEDFAVMFTDANFGDDVRS